MNNADEQPGPASSASRSHRLWDTDDTERRPIARPAPEHGDPPPPRVPGDADD